MNYLNYYFGTNNNGQSDQLIALLIEAGFEGFEEGNGYLVAYIQEDCFNETSFDEVIALFPSISYTRTIVENINWNRKWEKSFDPVIINDFVGIRADFHEPLSGSVAHEIIITPKMSFGTGHHATTNLMISQMRDIDFRDKSVLDFGTGTGVLAILAEKLGANAIKAIDNDSWSINNAAENIEQNQCTKISLSLADMPPVGNLYDIILANINLNVILIYIYVISSLLKPGGLAFLSGFLKENEKELCVKLELIDLQCIKIAQKREWLCIVAQKKAIC